MQQQEIDKMTKMILALNVDKEKIYEFICACKNSVSLIENKLSVDLMQVTYKAALKSLIKNLGK